MRLFYKGKDGGPESSVTGYWLCEIKSLFSIVLLKFEGKSREAYHSHAFNSISWVLSGRLYEEFRSGKGHPILPSLTPVFTYRDTYHKVDSDGTSWVLSFRGPWAASWSETRLTGEVTLTNGRVEV